MSPGGFWDSRLFSLPLMLAPLFALPLVARAVTPSQWAGISIGQGVGVVFGSLIQGGWTLLGPSEIARDFDAKGSIYVESLATQLIAALAGVPAAIALSILLSPHGDIPTVVAAAVSGIASALSPAWYCVAIGSPRTLFRYDTIPKAIGSVIGGIAVFWGAPAYVYPGLFTVAAVVGGRVFLKHAIGGLRGNFRGWPSARHRWRSQLGRRWLNRALLSIRARWPRGVCHCRTAARRCSLRIGRAFLPLSIITDTGV